MECAVIRLRIISHTVPYYCRGLLMNSFLKRGSPGEVRTLVDVRRLIFYFSHIKNFICKYDGNLGSKRFVS